MVGLRTQENTKFLSYWKIIQNEASKKGCVFFLIAARVTNGQMRKLSVRNLSGWLIPKSFLEQFEKGYMKFEASEDWNEEWDKFYTFAIWRHDKTSVCVNFKSFKLTEE